MDAVNRDDDPAVLLHLLHPFFIVFGLGSRSQERTVGIKEIEDFPSRDAHPQWFQSSEHFSMHFVYGLMGSQAELADEQDDIEPKGKAHQCQPIGLCAAIGAGMSGALAVRATIARMNHLDHALQCDDRSLRQRHGPTQTSLTLRA